MIFHKKSTLSEPKGPSVSYYTTYYPAASKIVESMPTADEHHRRDVRILGKKRLGAENTGYFDANTDAITDSYLRKHKTERSMTPILLLSHVQDLKGDLKMYKYEIDEWNDLLKEYEGGE